MGHFYSLRLAAALVLPVSCWIPSAMAQSGETDAVQPNVIISTNIGVVSDYRFRGLSYSNRDPALQGGIDAAFKSGWFVGTWASTIAKNSGSHTEIDLYGGYASEKNGVNYSATFYGYVYPGGSGVNYFELQGKVGKTIGPAHLELQLAYTPDQWNSTRDNLYIGAQTSVGIPGTPLTAKLRGGRENGSYNDKWDWEAGLSYSRRWLTVSASYVDTNYHGADEAGRLGSAGFVGSVIASF
jgi:uncharacterized protein (TIGR02001 family)